MRTSRLVALLLELTRVRRSTVADLAAPLGVSARTIQRDLVALQDMGVPVWTRTGPAGGVGLVEGWRSPLTGMMAAEVQALLLGQAGSRELGMHTEFETARAKMVSSPGAPQAMGESAVERFHIDHHRWFAEPERPPALPTVADAVWTGRRLSIRYERPGRPGEPVSRRLDPLGLVLKTDRWYLIAAHRRSVRTYRVSRITDATVHEEQAWRPADFSLADHWQRSQTQFERSVNSLPVCVSIPQSSAETLRAALPGTQIDAALEEARRTAGTSADPGGGTRLEVSLMTEALEIVGAQLLGVPGVEVHEPAELRGFLHGRGQDLAARNTPR
ncbi:helix-turn-helix transcriptional regulator [Nesterenkonia sp. HG001]|uniref:helix-turn-helix transcriptional regulator n=1 Tax=Nesterenkonia sp. HG001 TaxID=2983207 RepID=UPI002AC47A4D|nr:WYL domain-containing protein [Nesterenkonia sp. HG001]MDZ5077340.1 WYL domain-containing protein [Nesterenkonia sp. HG001]